MLLWDWVGHWQQAVDTSNYYVTWVAHYHSMWQAGNASVLKETLDLCVKFQRPACVDEAWNQFTNSREEGSARKFNLWTLTWALICAITTCGGTSLLSDHVTRMRKYVIWRCRSERCRWRRWCQSNRKLHQHTKTTWFPQLTWWSNLSHFISLSSHYSYIYIYHIMILSFILNPALANNKL